jgi:hypothetical protein
MKLTKSEYAKIHYWIKKEVPKTGSCTNCLSPGKTDWSNKSGRYLKVLSDWQELCRKCHYIYDTTVLGKKPIGTYGGGAAKVAKGFAKMPKDLVISLGKKGGEHNKGIPKGTRAYSARVIYLGKLYSYREVARELGLSRQRIYQIRDGGQNKYGLIFKIRNG